VVEIDESKSGKRKYNRGHRVKVQWAFGGVARENGRTFLVAVQDRMARDTDDRILPGNAVVIAGSCTGPRKMKETAMTISQYCS
jgi:hypothetical protein